MTPWAVDVLPRGPYSLRLSTRLSSDACRRVRDGVVEARLPEGRAVAWQRADRVVCIRAGSEAAAERLRWCLAVDDDHGEFLRRFATDPLLAEATRRLRGLRPVRVPTVAQALLRALAGQLITSREARAIERRIVRASTAADDDGLHAPPDGAHLAGYAPPQLSRFGLGGRRAATLVRLCRTLDLERLKDVPPAAAARRLEREPGLGPWSVGVVSLQGLGTWEHGLARDLGLVKLLAALRGRRVEPEETDELLEPYGEWAGLASVYLLNGARSGLVPLPA
jgi:3-methyladenine DNA glycosylase/8-oxoguanine DNA glycosylase